MTAVLLRAKTENTTPTDNTKSNNTSLYLLCIYIYIYICYVLFTRFTFAHVLTHSAWRIMPTRTITSLMLPLDQLLRYPEYLSLQQLS